MEQFEDRTLNEEARDEWIDILVPLIHMSRSIDVTKIQHLIDFEHRSHTFLPFVDPTAYRGQINNPNVDSNVRIMKAFVDFRKVIDEETTKRSS